MARPRKMNRVFYSQFLLSTQTNYTLTYFAEHAQEVSHDAVNNYLLRDKLTPSLLWEHINAEIVPSDDGYIIFDDSILNKNYSELIELARWQYSGNAKDIIKGIGMVTCVYYNPEIDRFWAIDYRIYAPEQDGKSKLNHVEDMLKNIIFSKGLNFSTVLMDTWYATPRLMLTIDSLKKIFYCPMRSNRLVSRVDQKYYHIPVRELSWTKDELTKGQRIHINKFPKNYHMQLFRIMVHSRRTDFVVTNDLSQESAEAVRDVYGFRWCIEELHREVKQLTGIQNCQCRKQRIQRNHIACAFLVWVKLKVIAYKTGQNVYQIKRNLLSDYLKQQLRSPTISMGLA